MTEEQKRAYILVHNQLTMNTGFDPEKLRQEIEAIETINLADYDLYIPVEFETDPEPEEIKAGPELYSFVLTLSEEQYQKLLQAVEIIKVACPTLHSYGNPNKRNNQIFEVVYQWAERKTLL